MAMPRLLTKTTPAETEIPRVYDDVRYAEAAAILATLTEFDHRLDREKKRENLEHFFLSRPKSRDTEADEPLRANLATLQAEPALGPSPTPSTIGATSPAVTRGLAILAGGKVGPLPNHDERIAEIERMQQVIGAAINEQAALVDEIAIELTCQFGKQLTPAWNSLQLELYRAAQRLAEVTRQVNIFRGATIAAGIRPRHDMLLMPNVRTPLILGSEDDQNSEISHWRRILERLGIIR